MSAVLPSRPSQTLTERSPSRRLQARSLHLSPSATPIGGRGCKISPMQALHNSPPPPPSTLPPRTAPSVSAPPPSPQPSPSKVQAQPILSPSPHPPACPSSPLIHQATSPPPVRSRTPRPVPPPLA